jgi:hypothetical protein
MPEDIDQTTTDTAGAAQGSSGGQSENWEERFKGLQRTLTAKDGHATKLQQQLTALQQQSKDDAARYEEELATLKAANATLTTDKTKFESQVTELSQTNKQLARDKDIRKVLADPQKDYKDLLVWYDAGHLKPGDLDGDALTAYLDSFKALLPTSQKQDDVPAENLGGASPPSMSTSSANTVGMTVEQMAKWLTANPRHAEYSKVEEAYFTALTKQK